MERLGIWLLPWDAGHGADGVESQDGECSALSTVWRGRSSEM